MAMKLSAEVFGHTPCLCRVTFIKLTILNDNNWFCSSGNFEGINRFHRCCWALLCPDPVDSQEHLSKS